MKTLYVMRHAKSAWGEPGLGDFDRPLLEKGKKRTKKVIDYLLNKRVKPELIITSPALRALETARIMLHGLHVDKDALQEEKSIYTSDAGQFSDVLFDIPASVSSIMIVGHNPAVTEFINSFLDVKIDPIPTSGIAAFEFNADDWNEIRKTDPKVKFIIYPKMLG
jgi:phosphohistidine phosphatase